MRSIAATPPIVDPESVGSGPRWKAIPPEIVPATTIHNAASTTSAMTEMYLDVTRRRLPTGLVRRYRSVPALASPAIASPDSKPAVNGKKNGCTTARAVSGAK